MTDNCAERDAYYDGLIQCDGCDAVVSGKAVVSGRHVYHPGCRPTTRTYLIHRTEHAFAEVEARDGTAAINVARDLDEREFSIDRQQSYFSATYPREGKEASLARLPTPSKPDPDRRAIRPDDPDDGDGKDSE